MLNLVIYDLVEHTMRYGKLSGQKAQTDYYQAMEKIAPSRGEPRTIEVPPIRNQPPLSKQLRVP
jgi:hypothetical protein